ncbi:MAG: FAD-dependent oxidoreductase [Microbacterium sp.]
MDLLIVGSGFFGLTIAERAAAAGRRVTVIERRHHLGGNAYSEPEPTTGIEVHRYGAHLFRTSTGLCGSTWLWFHRSPTTSTRVYTNDYGGVVYPLPINLGTISQFFQAAYSPDATRSLIAGQARSSTRRPRNLGRRRSG